MSEKHKKTCKYLNYVENLLILASTITGFNSYIIHDKFVSLDNVLRGYNEMKKQIKKS